MKRYIVLKNFIESLKDNDVAIFSGQEMCKEAYQYDRPGNFYIHDLYSVAPAFALGMAMCTDKRIFVFVGEGDLLRELAAASQIAASRCSNIFLVVLDNGTYQSAGNFPNIMESMRSKRGVMLNFGLVVFDFTVFLPKREFKKMRNFMQNLRGPVVLFMDIDKGVNKDLPDIDIAEEEMKERLTAFIKNKETGTSLYKISGPALHVNDVNPEVLTNGV